MATQKHDNAPMGHACMACCACVAGHAKESQAGHAWQWVNELGPAIQPKNKEVNEKLTLQLALNIAEIKAIMATIVKCADTT